MKIIKQIFKTLTKWRIRMQENKIIIMVFKEKITINLVDRKNSFSNKIKGKIYFKK